VSSHVAPLEARPARRSPAIPRVSTDLLLPAGIGAVLAAIALRAGGGLQLGPTSEVEIALELGGGLVAAGALLAGRDRRAAHGTPALLCFAALVALTIASVLWSVNPSDSWQEASRTLSYAVVFGVGIVFARFAPHRWDSILAGTVIASAIICVYALLTKVFPGALNPNEVYARLREPFGYWNAVGLMAALGAPGCLWLGARRDGHAALNALAYPALGLMLLTLLLAYSRGGLLALLIGVGIWFVLVPLRLRGVAVLAASATGAVIAAAWAFSQDGLSKDRMTIDERATAGHQFGLLLIVLVALLLVAGLAIGFASARRAPRRDTRRAAGVTILVILALVPVVAAAGLALSTRGLGGSISHGWNQLTDPHASTPPNDPGRLAAVGSVRARYWNEALKMWKGHPGKGVGAGGYATLRPRYRQDDLDVRHAHGYVVQTLADLGIAGMLISVALIGFWLVAATAAVGRRRGLPHSPERIGLLTLFTVVVVFAVHSFVDWTWFVPGNAVVALLCAGWLAGRGPLTPEPIAGGSLVGRMRSGLRMPARAGMAAAAVIVALIAAWATWQPLRSQNAMDDALTALERKDIKTARADAQAAQDRNPLAVEPLFVRSVVEQQAGDRRGARSALEDAVKLQPTNPEPWLRLANYALNVENDVAQAKAALGPALYLDPRSPTGISLFLQAQRRPAK
jgi:O-antigen ligase/Tfp pilus assembly protein PilF